MSSLVSRSRTISHLFKRLCAPISTTSTTALEQKHFHHRINTDQQRRHQHVRIGCASGFWGDTSVSAPQLVHHGNIDFLVFDYLAEITMSLLAKAKSINPDLGFAPDFVLYAVGPLLKTIKQKGIRVVSNAGGINPQACAAAMAKACAKAGVDMNIAVVTGDDLSSMLGGYEFQHHKLPNNIQSINAYLGAGPIARCLDLGADIVITGRCVDSAVTLAPLIHTYKWDLGDYNRLAAGSLAGHLIECGAQVTGGIFTDWESVPDWDVMGFPIVECYENGDFMVTKPPNTGGLVNTATVAEQLVYEIGDPENYLLPDVSCNFSNVTLENHPEQPHTVTVQGVSGTKPSDMYKTSATYMDGYRATAVSPIVGPNSVSKGERTAQAIIKRCSGIFRALGLDDFKRVHIEMLGSEGNYGRFRRNSYTRECVSWIAVEHSQKKALEIFVKELAPAGTGMAPGLTAIVGGRPKVSPVLKLHSLLFPKRFVDVDIHMNGELVERYREPEKTPSTSSVNVETKVSANDESESKVTEGSHTYQLGELAYTRSGDKGNDANIGVVCRNADYYPLLEHKLTAQMVEKYFSHLFEGDIKVGKCRVTRHKLPGIYGFNFVLQDVLGGGGVASLRSDPQGKALGQMLQDLRVGNVPDLGI